MALLVAVVPLAMGCRVPPDVGSPSFKSGDEAGVARSRGLKSTRSMRGQVHEDEGRLLIGKVEGLGVGGGFPTMDVVLNLPVVQRRNEFFYQIDFTEVSSLRVGQMVQH